MVLDDMFTYLTSGGLSTGMVFLGIMPTTPETAMTVYEAAGLRPDHAMGNVAGRAVMERPTVKVVSRAQSYQTARTNAQTAFVLLDGLPRRTINGVQYHYGHALQSPFLMGRDEQGRPLVAFNVELMKDMTTG